MLHQNSRKAPSLLKRVIKRSRGDADDVRFAKIAFYAGGLEFLEQFFWMFVREDRQLAPARVRVLRRDDRVTFRSSFVQQEFQVAGQLDRLRAQWFHSAGLIEDRI